MFELYILTGLITLLAFAGVFAPHRTMGASIRVLPEPVVEDLPEPPEDTEDTQPFIWLPFHQVKPIVDEQHFVDEEEVTKRFTVVSLPSTRPIDQPVWH